MRFHWAAIGVSNNGILYKQTSNSSILLEPNSFFMCARAFTHGMSWLPVLSIWFRAQNGDRNSTTCQDAHTHTHTSHLFNRTYLMRTSIYHDWQPLNIECHRAILNQQANAIYRFNISQIEISTGISHWMINVHNNYLHFFILSNIFSFFHTKENESSFFARAPAIW